MTGTGVLREAASARLAPDTVRGTFLELAERFRPQEAAGLDARWVIELSDAATHTIHIRDGACFVSVGNRSHPDATIRTDLGTWRDIVSGRRDPVSAFTSGHLQADGDLNLAMRLATLFRPGPETTRLVRTTRTDAAGTEIEALVTGRGTPVLLLHGLCASKISFLPTLDGLADRYEVHALDLPGFGKSDKPLPTGNRYSPSWMAGVVREYLRANNIRRAYLVGNSMGGRIATEVALRSPGRVLGIVGLCPAVAFDEWQWAGPALRLLRGQWLGLAPFPISRATVVAAIEDMFHDPSCIPAANMEAAAGEFLLGIEDRRNRLAITAAARHLGAERASGRRSFWNRVCKVNVPSYWVFGADDHLVSHRYAERVRTCLPEARVEVWPGIGHVPQFEAPDLTNERVGGFIDGLEGARASDVDPGLK